MSAYLATPEYAAAMALVHVQRPRNVSERDAADVVYYSRDMLWYSQVQQWADHPPAGAPSTWQSACRVLLEIVSKGYDAEHKTWWYMGGMSRIEQAAALLLLMDFGMMVQQARHNTLMVIPASLDVVLDIICGRNWEKRYQQWLAKQKGAVTP